ncbi:MAG: glycosyltransferase family 2 protein [Microthrixaceae bacterium]
MVELRRPRVRVVVLNWNAAWFTRRCLAALAETRYPAEALEVVLVDNASVDGSLEQLRAAFPDVTLVSNEENLGFAEGCNRAMRGLDGTDYVALVNNDAVPEPGWLEPLVAALEDDGEAGAAAAMLVLEPAFTRVELDVEDGSALLRSVRVGGVDVLDRCLSDGLRSVGRPDWPLTVDHHVDDHATLLLPAGPGDRSVAVSATGTGTLSVRTGADSAVLVLGPVTKHVQLRAGDDREERLNGLGTALNDVGEGYDRHYGEPVAAARGESGMDVEGFCGGGVLLRSEMLAQIGLFDPAFFAYYEDTDLSWRARRSGYRTVAVPASVIRHAFGGSAGAKARGFFFLNYRNWLLSVLRNGDRSQRRRALGRVTERFRWAVRANLLSPLKHGRRPDVMLIGEWVRVLTGMVAARVAMRARRLVAGPGGRSPGASRTVRVRSRLQPTPRHRPPSSRSGGPLLVYVELSDSDLSAIRSNGPCATPACRLAVGLGSARPAIDAVAVTASATAGSGYRRATPAEWADMLGLGRTGVRTVPSADLDLDELDPCAVLVVGDRSAEGGLAASAMVAMATTTVAELGDGALESDLVEVVADELLTRYGTP